MPAAAVIPAPIAYIKVVAVKKLVVGFLVMNPGPSFAGCVPGFRNHLWENCIWHLFVGYKFLIIYCE